METQRANCDAKYKSQGATENVHHRRRICKNQMNELPALVIDLGSAFIKAGFAGMNWPTAIFPSTMGASGRRGEIQLNSPIEGRVICDWEDLEQLLRHTFHDVLNASPKDHAVMIADGVFAPRGQRYELAQLLFQQFEVPAVCFVNQAILTLFQTGRSTGIVLDMGEEVCDAVPILDDLVLTHAEKRLQLGGRNVTQELTRLLRARGHIIVEPQIMSDLKHALAYVAQNFDNEMASECLEVSEQLPDGRVLGLGRERFRCTEGLFAPDKIGINDVGIHRKIIDAIRECDRNIHDELYENIVLSGGASQLPGLAERLTLELNSLVPSGTRVNVVARPERQCSAWIGGSFMAQSEMFDWMWVHRDEYALDGADIVQMKCGLC